MFQIRWIWKNLIGYRFIYILAIVLTAVSVSMILVGPLVVQQIVDQIIIGVTQPGGEVIRYTEKLLPMVSILIGFSIFKTSLFYVVVMIFEKVSQEFIYKIRNHIFNNISNQDMSFFDKNKTGDLMTRLTGDIDIIRHTIAWVVRNIIESLVMFSVTTIYFLSVDLVFTIFMLILTPALYFITKSFSKKVRPKYIKLRDKLSSLNSCAQENISGNKVVKAFAREEYEKEKFDEKNKDYREANKSATFTWLKYYPFVESIAQSLNFITLLVGGYFMIIGRITSGELLAFSALSWTIAVPMRNLGVLLNDLQRFFTSASKIIEIYYSHPYIISRFNCVERDLITGNIEFKDISLKVDNKPILKNINLKINNGETIVIMGAIGSGKTSLINLIARLYDPYEGSVFVDGVDVKDWNLNSLRSGIGMTTQDVFLFSDTVDGNISYGNSKMSESEVLRYANKASASFINNMAEGFDTVIGERGVGLSGGQKQRIALARALAIKPKILILDDTTSAVDVETEKRIQSDLKDLDFECTKIIITQRTTFSSSADKIIIINEGSISEEGNHDDLINKKGYYYDIYCVQHGIN